MKTSIVSIFLLLSTMSCSEDKKSNIDTQVIKVRLNGAEFYEYNIADAIPTEGGYEIRKQAENYQISKMNWGDYQFQAKEGFKGTEKVEIVLSSSIGDDNFKDQKKWVFEIKIK